MLPRPANQKRQVKAEDVEAHERIQPAHFAARYFPKFAQRPRFVIVADDGELSAGAKLRRRLAFGVITHDADGDDAPRQRVERGALDEVAAMIRLGLGDFLRDLRGVFQVARFNFRRVERWE